jgi:hypothetical protein
VRFCIPGWQAGDAAGTPPPCKLEELVASISRSVGAVVSPAAQTALAAAAGGDFQKCREQLEALSAAQAAVREGLISASLAVLVQQLQATGVMLCNIAVPHFLQQPCLWEC